MCAGLRARKKAWIWRTRPWMVRVGVLASHALSAAQMRSTGLSCWLERAPPCTTTLGWVASSRSHKALRLALTALGDLVDKAAGGQLDHAIARPRHRWCADAIPSPRVTCRAPGQLLGHGSKITTAVSDDLSAAKASSFASISRHLRHRRDRSSPFATRALTGRGPSTRTTLASGCARRFNHQAGSPSAQPFIAIAMRFGPSSR